MFGLSLGEMVVLGGIALIAIDPKDLPTVARKVGRFINEMKRATNELSRNFTDVHDTARTNFGDTHKALNDVFSAVAKPDAPPTGPTTIAATPEQAPPPPVAGSPETGPASAEPTEEQLMFRLTNFEDEDSSGRGRK